MLCFLEAICAVFRDVLRPKIGRNRWRDLGHGRVSAGDLRIALGLCEWYCSIEPLLFMNTLIARKLIQGQYVSHLAMRWQVAFGEVKLIS